MNQDVTVSIVADGARYSAMTEALAASIHHHHQSEKNLRIAIGIPEDNRSGEYLKETPWGKSASFIDLPTPGMVDTRTNAAYRHSNKISLLEAAIKKWPDSHHLLLDSDLLALRRLPLTYLSGHTAAAMPVHYYGWHGNWVRLYETVEGRPEYLTVSSSGGQIGPPYFNAGFVWISKTICQRLEWMKVAEEIYSAFRHEPEMMVFPWLDQLSLPIAVERAGARIYELNDNFNMLADKLRAMIAAEDLIKDSSFSVRSPFVLHHHGDVQGAIEITENIAPQLWESPPFQSSLHRMRQLFEQGVIGKNRAHTKRHTRPTQKNTQ